MRGADNNLDSPRTAIKMSSPQIVFDRIKSGYCIFNTKIS